MSFVSGFFGSQVSMPLLSSFNQLLTSVKSAAVSDACCFVWTRRSRSNIFVLNGNGSRVISTRVAGTWSCRGVVHGVCCQHALA